MGINAPSRSNRRISASETASARAVSRVRKKTTRYSGGGGDGGGGATSQYSLYGVRRSKGGTALATSWISCQASGLSSHSRLPRHASTRHAVGSRFGASKAVIMRYPPSGSGEANRSSRMDVLCWRKLRSQNLVRLLPSTAYCAPSAHIVSPPGLLADPIMSRSPRCENNSTSLIATASGFLGTG